MLIPSLSDYGIKGSSAYPELWDQCLLAVCPGLGSTGSLVTDYVSEKTRSLANYSASRWVYDNGIPAISFTEGTNGSATWGGSTSERGLNWETNNLSISFWVYLPAAPTTTAKCVSSVGYTGLTKRVLLNLDQTITANWSNGALSITSASSLSLNQWYHVVMQRSRDQSNRRELFINGLRDASATGGTTLSVTNSTTQVCFGARNDSGTISAQPGCRLDDLRYYSRNLSYSEVELLSTQRGISYYPRYTNRKFWTGSSVADETFTAALTATTNSTTSSSASSLQFLGTLSGTTQTPTLTATCALVFVGTSSGTTGTTTGTTTATETFLSTLSVQTSPSTSTAAATETFLSSLSKTTDGPTISATVTQTSGTAGNLNQTTTSSTLTSSATQSFLGTLSQTTSSSSLSSSVATKLTASLSATSGDTTSTITGSSSFISSVSSTTGSTVSTITATTTQTFSAQVSLTLPGPTLLMTGNITLVVVSVMEFTADFVQPVFNANSVSPIFTMNYPKTN